MIWLSKCDVNEVISKYANLDDDVRETKIDEILTVVANKLDEHEDLKAEGFPEQFRSLIGSDASLDDFDDIMDDLYDYCNDHSIWLGLF